MQKRTRRAWKREQARRRRPWLLHAGPSFHRAHPSEARGTQSNTSVGQAPGPGSEAQALLGKGGSSRSVPRIWPPLASQCQAARPQSLWRKFWFAVPEGRGPPRRLPTPWDCLGAGHRKVLREAQPSRWGYSWVLPGALQAIAPFSEPSGPQWMQRPSPRPLLPAPGGPFLPRTPGADTNAYPHAGPPSPEPHPATPSDPKPEVEEAASEAAWGYRPDPAPTSPGPPGRQYVHRTWLPARAR